MDKDTVRLIIAVEEKIKGLTEQVHEVKLVALATKDTLSSLNPKAAQIYERAYSGHSRELGATHLALIQEHDATIALLNRLLTEIR